jgi:thioredoxin-like negative regulator of GroEL
VILFRDGEEVARFGSARTFQWVQAFLDQHLAMGAGAQAAE